MVEQAMEGVLGKALEEEKALDAKLKKMEEMTEDDFEALRQKRKKMLQKKVQQEQIWAHNGHGRYLELTDTKEFFAAAKKSERMVVHFYRGVTPRCEIVDAHFNKLAPAHLETRFCKIDVEKNPFLVERLGIVLIPTITLIKDGKTEHSIHGFDEMGGTDDFKTEDFAFVLSQHGVLNYEGDRSDSIAKSAARGGVNAINIRASQLAAPDSDEDDYDLDNVY